MKKRTKKLIAFLILLLLAAGFICLGLFADRLFGREDDALQLSDADIGRTVTLRMTDEAVDGDDTNYLLDFNQDPEENTMMRVIVPPELVNDFRGAFESKDLFCGVFGRCTDEMMKENEQYVLNYMDMLAECMNDFEVTEEMKAAIPDYLSPYCVNLTELRPANGPAKYVRIAAYVLGGLLALAALCMLIAAISGAKFGKAALIVGLILGIPLLIFCILFFNKIRSVLSIQKAGSGLYCMEYTGTLKTDKLLETDIHSLPEMVEWIRKEEYCGLPFSIDMDNIGCSAFAAKTPEGNVLMGRNFDYGETDTLMVHTAPKNGYASYAMADLKVMGVGNLNGLIRPDTLLGKIIMLAVPYGVSDGVNEAGLGVSILELTIGETHMNTEKHDLSIYTAIRVLLDKCATVDEALTLLADQDIHTGVGVSYHLFIADKTGRSVVVEWLDGEMCVNELNAATNSVLTEGAHFGEGSNDKRYSILVDGLKEHGSILTKDEARDLLEAASKGNTEWSCVYDLTDFSFDVYMDRCYEVPIRFPQ